MWNDKKTWSSLLWAGLALWAAQAAAQPLTLAEAERLAIENDPGIRALQLQSGAFEERSVAAAQLPDPSLSFGALALPVDSFDLNQEPMTQLQLGVQQKFPPGKTLELRGRRMDKRGEISAWMARTRRETTVRDVRESYLETLYWQRGLAIIRETRRAFEELLEVTRDAYASGRTRQHDVYRAKLELSRLEERQTRMEQRLDEQRAMLAVHVGERAAGELQSGWPDMPGPDTLEALEDRLLDHPQIRALSGQIDEAAIGEDLAREQYKPGWSVDLRYGDRSGQGPTGAARPDFLSAMVMVELPIFRDRRQDRELAASGREREASVARRDDALRRMLRQAQMERASVERLEERLSLFGERLLPDARDNSESSLEAYQSGVADFTTLMRARITDYELQLEALRTRVDLLKARARLRFLLAGEPS